MNTKSTISKVNRRITVETKRMREYSENGIRFKQMGDDIYKWRATLSDFDKDTKIYNELKKHSIEHILMEIIIPRDYPFSAPFIRVVSPRFMGYKGYITTGGSLCTDMLTPAGWAPCLQILNLMTHMKILIKDAIIDKINIHKEYTIEEARHHYNRTTNIHRWDKVSS